MKNKPKKLLKKHKMVLEMVKTGCDFYQVQDRFGITNEDIKFWRKTISNFDSLYLEAIGLTRVQEQFLDILQKKLLNVAAACRACGISRQTYYRWRDNSDTFNTFLRDLTEGFKDDVESILFHKIFVEQNLRAFTLFANAKMKDRGYGITRICIVEEGQNTSGLNDYSKYTIQELEAEIALLEGKKS